MVKSGPVAHMPLDERLALATFYDQLENQIHSLAAESSIDEVIVGFDDSTDLNEEQRSTLLKAVAQAKRPCCTMPAELPRGRSTWAQAPLNQDRLEPAGQPRDD